MKYLVIIPARFESSRFPGKPLAKIGGVEMILRVCSQVAKSGHPLIVATDNELIKQTVEDAGYDAVMTRADHRSGTERVEEAFRLSGSDADVVINVQGDEPFIDPDQIAQLASIFENIPDTHIATLVRPFDPGSGIMALEDPNLVKVVMDESGKALYFSRSVIPYVRKVDKEHWPEHVTFYSHIGIYAYRSDILPEIVKMPETALERAESLEQLRWLQNGKTIMTGVSTLPTIGIDTPADLAAAEKYLASIGN